MKQHATDYFFRGLTTAAVCADFGHSVHDCMLPFKVFSHIPNLCLEINSLLLKIIP